MKTPLWASIFHVLVFLLFALPRHGVAYEDPEAEVARRQEQHFRARLQAFRQEYRNAFPLSLDDFPQPKQYEVLFVYPDEIHKPYRELLHYGLETPASKVLLRLKRLHIETRKTLLSSFHPDMIEKQPFRVREKHLDTFTSLASWISMRQYELADHVGKRNVDLHLSFFRRVRNLADLATTIPTPEVSRIPSP